MATPRKYFVTYFLLFAIVFSPFAAFAHQDTSEHNEQHEIESMMAQINELLEIIALLQAQIVAKEGGIVASIDPITRNLKIGDEGSDVRDLQLFLNSNSKTQVAVSGPGSTGRESTFFGNLTKNAVIKFQELYKVEILTPNGLVRGSGFVGPSTRDKINSLSIDHRQKKSTPVQETDPSNIVDEESDSSDDSDTEESDEKDPLADTTPPTISNISTNNVSKSDANVLWSTNEPADTKVEYGLTKSYGKESVLGNTLAMTHNVYLTGLLPDSKYNYRVISSDTEGNTTASPNQTFSTEPASLVADPNNYTLTRLALGPDELLPIDLSFDRKGNVWVVGEMQRSVVRINAQTNNISYFMLPDEGNIFAWSPAGNTSLSVLGEDITLDSSGNIWSTQGGAFAEYASDTNHSRIVYVDTDTNEITTYKVPDNHNQVVGIMYDESADRIYFIESGLVSGAQPRLVSFSPGSIDTSIGYDDPEGLLGLRCEDALNIDNCYLTEDIPFGQPARLTKGLDGNIYFTGYFSHYLGRYNPVTHDFVKFELPAPRSDFSEEYVSSFPWDIEVDSTTGDILITETFDQQIIRFQTNKEAAGSCQIERTSADNVVTSRGSNSSESCIVEYEARPAGYKSQNGELTHSLDQDQYGNIWFTTTNHVGVIPAEGGEAAFRQFIGGNGIREEWIEHDVLGGIKVNDDTGEIWVTSTLSREIYRLTPDFTR